jgi:hypothetical protein
MAGQFEFQVVIQGGHSWAAVRTKIAGYFRAYAAKKSDRREFHTVCLTYAQTVNKADDETRSRVYAH